MTSSAPRRGGRGLSPPIVHNRLSDDEERYIIWSMLRPKRDNQHPRYAPGRICSVLERILRTAENSRQFKEYITRLLGYGAVDVERVPECTAYRATAISCGVLTKDKSHIHRFPLPPSLSGQHGRRRLTITLAWMTPVNPRHQ